MRMILLMIGYHEKPIATGTIIKRCNFNEIGQNVNGKLHSQNLYENWADGTEIRTEPILRPSLTV